MLSNGNEQAAVRRYLLGQLGDEAREQFEQTLLTQDEVFAQLLAVEDELVDEYLSGSLAPDEAEMFAKHFLNSAERQQKLRFAKAFKKYAEAHVSEQPRPEKTRGPAPRSTWWPQFTASPWLAVAVAAVMLLAATAVWRVFIYRSDVDKGLIALNNAYKDQRPLEARITKLDYAPFAVTRGGEAAPVDSRERDFAERYLLDAVRDHPGAPAYHALGKFYLAERNFDKAIANFEEGLEADPNNARLHSDLGAALLEKGKADRLGDEAGKGFQELAKSLEHLNKALELDSSLLEALFNRALVHQEMALPQQAEGDWREYLEKDSHSRWTDEARRNLILIEEQRKETSRSRGELLQDFLSAYESRDDERALQVISRSREALSRKLIWEQLLDEILSAPKHGSKSDSESKLKALLYEGDLEHRTAGDEFVSGLAQFYRSSPEYQWRLLAEARVQMKQGHEYYFQHKLDNAIQAYEKARQIFLDLGDKWESQYAKHWIGYCYYEQGKTQESISVLEELARSLQKENCEWLLMRTLHLISSGYHNLNEYSKAIDYNRQALLIAERINDLIGIFNASSILTFQYSSMGNHQQAFANAQRSLSVMPDCPLNEIQFARQYTIIALACDGAGFYNAAIDYQKEGLRRAIAMGHIQHISLDYARIGLMYAKLGNYDEAHRNLDLAYSAAESSPDETPRNEMMAFSALQSGHLYRAQGDFSKAINSYDESIALADHFHFKYDVYEAHKNRLFCYLAVGDDRSTAEELNTTLDLAERYRSTILEADDRNDFFDIQQSVYDLAIDFAYSRLKEPQKAFAYSEKSRSRSLLDSVLGRPGNTGEKESPALSFASIAEPLDLTEIQRRLPEEAQILDYAVLNDSVLIWVISKNQFSTVEKKINQNDLKKKVEAYVRLVSVANDRGEEVKNRARDIFDDLIKPVEPLLQRDKTVYLIPDKFLNTLPFSTLIGETGRLLFEDYRLEISPSSSLLVALSEIASKKDGPQKETLLSVGNPRFDRHEFPSLSDLPSAEREAEEVAHSYDSSRVLTGANATRQRVTSQMPSADIIHFALHAVANEQSPLRSRLIFAKDSTLANDQPFEGSLQASEIYELKLPRTRLAVLSACQTGVEHYYGGEQMISLARPFLAVGVPLVLVSLWPVDSDVTAELMICFHKHRKQDNVSSAEALRRAQSDMLRRPEERFHSAFCWGAFVLIGGPTKF